MTPTALLEDRRRSTSATVEFEGHTFPLPDFADGDQPVLVEFRSASSEDIADEKRR